MATVADNNNKARSGLELGLDSGILRHPERHILGTIPQHHALYLHQAGKVMVSIIVDIVMSCPCYLTDCLPEKIWTFLINLGVWVGSLTQAGLGLTE